ncbi:MAG: glycerol-3-phosphate dehydrogenase [Xanthobacteraceae bacterium]|nr:glycerol-3-phosphate dehydrogenase [Xanthobacteraceae bacterium]
MADFDIAVIGGGLNGVSVARDAAGRGLRVVLIEQNDIGSGATAVSPGVLEGHFTDIEHGAFLRVRRALAERDALLRAAPHLVRPVRCVVPMHPDERSPAMLRAALFAHDRLVPRGFHEKTKELDLTHHAIGHPLKRPIGVAFGYSACLVDETRLASLTARDAAERGASILTGARCVRGERSDIWRLSLVNRGQRQVVTARALVNATGAWTRTFAETALKLKPVEVVFERVTQIVMPALFAHDSVYVLQHSDGSLIYAMPYQGRYTLIGVARRPFDGDPAFASATSADIGYLCEAVTRYFREPVEPFDVCHAYAGVDVIAAGDVGRRQRRDGRIVFERPHGEAPLLSICGGASVTIRRRAELAIGRLVQFFVAAPPWTATATLPGGDFSYDKFGHEVDAARGRWPFLKETDVRRLAGAYGSRLDQVLGDAAAMDDLGQRFGEGLTAAEVRYLITHEFARFADDVLWRRSKLGLGMPKADRDALIAFMAEAA